MGGDDECTARNRPAGRSATPQGRSKDPANVLVRLPARCALARVLEAPTSHRCFLQKYAFRRCYGHSLFDARPSWKPLGGAAIHVDDVGRLFVGDLRQALYSGCESSSAGADGHSALANNRLQCRFVKAAGMASEAHALKFARLCPRIEAPRPRKGVRFPSTARFKESPAKATGWLPFAFWQAETQTSPLLSLFSPWRAWNYFTIRIANGNGIVLIMKNLLDLLQIIAAALDVVIRALELFGHASGAFLM